MTKEVGAIEVASATLWGAAVAALSFASYVQLAFRWPVVVGFALLGARELGQDKAFLSKDVLQLRIFSGALPLNETRIGVAVIALMLTVLWKLSRKAGFFPARVAPRAGRLGLDDQRHGAAGRL